MALPSSGALSMSAINTELGRTSNTANTKLAGGSTPSNDSLFGLASTSVNKVAPHAISEFYGYNHSTFPTSGLVAGYDWTSYPGSGTSWNDISGNGRTMTLTNPNYDSNYGGFFVGSNTNFAIPGSSALYGNFGAGQPFTWIIAATWDSSIYQDLTGLFWSESSAKNFLTGMWYAHTGSNFTPRVDSCCTSMASWNAGQPASNTGPSPSQASFDWTDVCRTSMIIIQKNTSDQIFFYGMNYQNSTTPLFLWNSNAFSNWGQSWNTSQPINVMARSQGSFFATGKLFSVYMWNRLLSTSEIAQVYDQNYGAAVPC